MFQICQNDNGGFCFMHGFLEDGRPRPGAFVAKNVHQRPGVVACRADGRPKRFAGMVDSGAGAQRQLQSYSGLDTAMIGDVRCAAME
ncbi:MAG: hypothetical protein JNM58_17580 [Xanthomonadaceae bacterium]|nr:hypothetical protein [Xanthomonadaceae bacterium]